jgi:hypothetical protein
VIINTFDPRHWATLTRPLLEPEIVRAYTSPRVVQPPEKGNLKSGYGTGSTLYLVSNAYNISLFDQGGLPVMEFAPLRFKAAINGQMLADLKFGEAEKPLAKIYFYNTGDMSWTSVSQDLEAHADTVGTDVSKSGTYAIGIEIFPAHDKKAPEILDHYPTEGGTIEPDTRIWAKLFEDNTGVGIDFGSTSLSVDGVEQDATWDPVNSIIAWKPLLPLTLGAHAYVVHVTDYQGNSRELAVAFTVNTSGIENTAGPGAGELFLYPNPASESLTIEFGTENVISCDVAVYNSNGIRVAGLYTGKSGQGVNRFTWGRLTDDGKRAAGGIYFVRIRMADRALVKKVVLQ